MSATTTDPVTAFRAGRIFGEGFRTFCRNFVSFFLIAAIVDLPFVVIRYVGSTTAIGTTASHAATAYSRSGSISTSYSEPLWIAAISSVMLTVVGGLIQYLTYQRMQGRDVTVVAALSKFACRLLPIILVAILMYALTMLGAVLLLVPGIIMACGLAVCVPVCMIEDRGVFDSLSRSWVLTKGHRGTIFLVWLIFMAVAVVALIGVLIVAIIFHNVIVYHVTNLVWEASAVALLSSITAVAYFYLRALKDGVAVSDVASVFD